MHKLLLLFTFWLISGNLYAQVQWGHQIGAEGSDNLEQHIVDKEENIISVGYFESTSTIGSQQLTSMGSTDIFMYKSTPTGQIIWAKALNSPGHAGDVGVSTDKFGNIYVSGGFVSELYLEGERILKGNNYWNAFLCKFDQDGNLIWTRGVLGEGAWGEARSLGVVSANAEGEVVLAVNFTTSVRLDDHVFTNSETGGSSLLIAKFSPVGKLEWYVNPASYANIMARDIHLAENGSVYLTGFYTGTFEVGPYSNSSISEFHSDIFVAKFDRQGQVDWLRTFNKTEKAEINNTANTLLVDPHTEEVYLAGMFKGNVDFDGLVIEGINTSEDPGNADIFLSRLAADGAVVWAKRFGTDSHDIAWDLKQDDSGNLVLAGSWGGALSIQLFDTDGSPGKYVSVDAPGIALSVTPFGQGGYYLSGLFYGLFDEDAFSWRSKGVKDGFLVKIAACLASDPLPEKPALTYTCTGISVDNLNGTGKVKWYRDNVEIQPQSVNKLVNPHNGAYKVSVQNACGVTFSDVIHFDNSSALPEAPLLYQVSCRKIAVRNQGQNTITWYKNGQVLPGERNAELTISGDGQYTVQFQNECGTTSARLLVNAGSFPKNYTTYNIITPNGDGKNEHLVLDPALEGSSLQVYNRWGNKVYESKEYRNDWNGQGLAAAVYYWVVANECAGNLKGTVTIVR